MPRAIYVNDAWVEEPDAKVSVFDRGFLFADAVYEVTAVIGGKLIGYQGHAERLGRSLRELGISEPMSADALLALHREAVSRNAVAEGLIYLQVTRGVAERDFLIRDGGRPGFVMFTQAKSVVDNPKFETGLRLRTMPDLRWGRRDIKTVQLLYSSLAKSEAVRDGYDDVILVENGLVTEASSANLHIVDATGTLLTPPLSRSLLPGITRGSVLAIARENGIPVKETQIALEALSSAREVFVTSATSFVLPVTEIDGHAIGDGLVGPATRRMRELYIEDALAGAI